MDGARASELSRKRAKLEKKPRYGTVGTRYFVPGLPHLNDAEPVRWSAGEIMGPAHAAYAAADVIAPMLESKSAPASPEKAVGGNQQPLSSRLP